MVFPRFLFEVEISETAKLLYMLLLDRARLSMKNERWTDSQGHIFIYFTITDLARTLHKGEVTTKNSLALLERCGLVQRNRQGGGQPNKIYVKVPSDKHRNTDMDPAPGQTENYPLDRQKTDRMRDKKLSAGQSENYPLEGQETDCWTDRKLSSSNNKRVIRGVKRESNTAPHILGSFQNVFLTDEELEDLKSTVPSWEQYLERLSSYIASSGKDYNNHAATIKSWALRDSQISQSRVYECEEGESL